MKIKYRVLKKTMFPCKSWTPFLSRNNNYIHVLFVTFHSVQPEVTPPPFCSSWNLRKSMDCGGVRFYYVSYGYISVFPLLKIIDYVTNGKSILVLEWIESGLWSNSLPHAHTLQGFHLGVWGESCLWHSSPHSEVIPLQFLPSMASFPPLIPPPQVDHYPLIKKVKRKLCFTMVKLQQ